MVFKYRDYACKVLIRRCSWYLVPGTILVSTPSSYYSRANARYLDSDESNRSKQRWHLEAPLVLSNLASSCVFRGHFFFSELAFGPNRIGMSLKLSIRPHHRRGPNMRIVVTTPRTLPTIFVF